MAGIDVNQGRLVILTIVVDFFGWRELDEKNCSGLSCHPGRIMLDSFQLVKLGRRDLLCIFQQLTPPSVAEMDGEFRATLLDQGHWTHNFLTASAFNLPGSWISKSFTPLSDEQGCGYNTFRIGDRTRKMYRMGTYVSESRIDDGRSFHLDYRSVPGQEAVPKYSHLAGEVRRLSDSLFLGIGTADFGVRRLRRSQPFLLEGPVAPYVPLRGAFLARDAA